MARERTSTRRSAKEAARRTKKKPCLLCRDKVDWVDYKDVQLLRKYMSDRGKIRARRVSGNCAQHQREIALAIKTARELVLLPYTQRTVTERSGGRGRGGRGPGGRPSSHAPGDEGAETSRAPADDLRAPRSLEGADKPETSDRGDASGEQGAAPGGAGSDAGADRGGEQQEPASVAASAPSEEDES
jgi:small subunit ribosomal protein S18